MPIKMSTGNDNYVEEVEDVRYVTVNVPTDANTALAVDIDDTVEITIKGKVKGVHATKGEDCWGTPGDLRIEVDSIEVDGKNAFESMLDQVAVYVA